MQLVDYFARVQNSGKLFALFAHLTIATISIISSLIRGFREMWPSIVALVLLNHVECTTLQNESSKNRGQFLYRALQNRGQQIHNVALARTVIVLDSVGVDASKSTLLSISFHLMIIFCTTILRLRVEF